MCAETIKAEARACRYCGHRFEGNEVEWATYRAHSLAYMDWLQQQWKRRVRRPRPGTGPETIAICASCGQSIDLASGTCVACGGVLTDVEVQEAVRRAQLCARDLDKHAHHSQLESKRNTRLGWGWFLAVLGGILAAFMIAMFFSPPAPGNTGSEQRLAAAVCFAVLAVPPLALGIFLLTRAARIRDKLEALESDTDPS